MRQQFPVWAPASLKINLMQDRHDCQQAIVLGLIFRRLKMDSSQQPIACVLKTPTTSKKYQDLTGTGLAQRKIMQWPSQNVLSLGFVIVYISTVFLCNTSPLGSFR